MNAARFSTPSPRINAFGRTVHIMGEGKAWVAGSCVAKMELEKLRGFSAEIESHDPLYVGCPKGGGGGMGGATQPGNRRLGTRLLLRKGTRLLFLGLSVLRVGNSCLPGHGIAKCVCPTRIAPGKGCPTGGFTLMEMLLAITILAVIVVFVGGAMRLGYRSTEKGEKKIEFAERVRRSIEIVEGQVQSFLPLVAEEQAEKKPYFSGGRKNLALVTNYSAWDGRRGYILARYTVRSEGGKESLFLTENSLGSQSVTETVLLKDCDAIEFSYREQGLTAQSTRWLDEWVDAETTPDRIRIGIKFGTWGHSLVIPLRAGGRA